jgi:hypothetical protein
MAKPVSPSQAQGAARAEKLREIQTTLGDASDELRDAWRHEPNEPIRDELDFLRTTLDVLIRRLAVAANASEARHG